MCKFLIAGKSRPHSSESGRPRVDPGWPSSVGKNGVPRNGSGPASRRSNGMAYNIPFLHTENHHPLLLANRSIKWCTVLCSRPSRSVCCAVFRLFLLSLWYRCLALLRQPSPCRSPFSNGGEPLMMVLLTVAGCQTAPHHHHYKVRCVCVSFVEGDIMKFESFTEIWFRGIERGCTCSFVG